MTLGEPEAEHGEAHHQRAEMRPAADREDPHQPDLERDHRARDQADREIERHVCPRPHERRVAGG